MEDSATRTPPRREASTPPPPPRPAVLLKMPFVDDGFEALLEPFYNGKKLTDPVSTKEDKFQLLPAFLKVKGTRRPRIPP